jgi:HAD superfamily hydrolase (TIGR01549 family)
VNLTLLLDLDDTLLVNPLDQFLPTYLQKLSTYLAPYADPSLIIQALMAGTRQMIENLKPDCSLKEVFDAVFYPLIKVSPTVIDPAIYHFYAEIFPSLQGLTHPRAGAIELVKTAFERGYQVAIATSPLFPRTAIAQRLEWAGLSPEKYPFALITSYETFHFSKPNPVYFAETLARLGWPEGAVLVVGDDLENDIRPAQKLGLPTYWVQPNQDRPQVAITSPGSIGGLDALVSWLEQTPPEVLQPQYNEPAALTAILRSTPAALNSLCQPLNISQMSVRPKADEWSPGEILCHLRDVDSEVNLPRLKKYLEEDNPFLPGQDTDRWAEERDYLHQDGKRALQHFSATRQRLLRVLDEASPADWERTARHAIFGPTLLKELVAIIARHDQLHIRQMLDTVES